MSLISSIGARNTAKVMRPPRAIVIRAGVDGRTEEAGYIVCSSILALEAKALLQHRGSPYIELRIGGYGTDLCQTAANEIARCGDVKLQACDLRQH